MKLSKINYSEFLIRVLYPKFYVIEIERRRSLNNFIFFEFFFIFVIVMILLRFPAHPVVILIGLIGITFGSVLLFKFIFKKYRSAYKNKILPIFFKEIFDEYGYFPELKLKEEDFLSTLIFQDKYNRYKGEDYIEGVFKGHDIKMSELLVKYVDQNNRKRRKNEKIIFKGVMFIIKISTPLKAETILYPDVSEKYFGYIGKSLQVKTKLNHEIVRLESIEFEKEFKVCSSDQIEARKIFTPQIQEKIIHLKKRTRFKFSISLQSKQLSIAIHTGENFFEPEYFQSNTKSKTLRDSVELFLFLEDIMEHLRLQ